MSFASRFAVSVALVAAAAVPALAQPAATPPAATPLAATPPAPPAPQNADWSQVSNINGQLVPVGEKNSYFYDFKRTIISANPLGWIEGFYGISASYALNDHIALRGELDYIKIPHDQTSTIEVDVGVPIYFRRTYQGVFLEPGLVVRTIRPSVGEEYDAAGDEVGQTGSPTAVGPQVLVGWHWTWESGLNVAAAIGLGRNLNSSDPYSHQVIPNGYLRFGYAF